MPSVSKGLYKWLLWRGATLEDFADRLNHFWTCGLLILLACIISCNQTYNTPINCWTPAEFPGTHVDYANIQCWNSYFIQYPNDVEKAAKQIAEMFNITVQRPFIVASEPFTDNPAVFSDDVDESNSLHTKMSTKRTLYQWVPVILCFQALLFKLPNLLMYILHGLSGINFDKIAGVTSGYEQMNLTERILLSEKIGRYIFNWCQQFQNWLPWRLLTLLWLVVKFLYCVNIIAQMCLIDAFLKTTDPPLDNSTSYGDVIGRNLFKNNATTWKESPTFPRRIFCNFDIFSFNSIHRFTVQCVLPANYFNEYVYMFIWVWFIFVAIVTSLSLVIWLLKTLVPVSRKRYIQRALALANDSDFSAIQSYDISQFCDIIGEDGVMVLKLAAANSSQILVADIVGCMWKIKTREGNPQRGGQNFIRSLPEIQIHPTAPVGSPGTTTTIGVEGQTAAIAAKKTD